MESSRPLSGEPGRLRGLVSDGREGASLTAKSENTAVRIALIVFIVFLISVLVGVLLPKDRYGYPSSLSVLFVQGGSILAWWSFVVLCIVLLHRRRRKRQLKLDPKVLLHREGAQQALDGSTTDNTHALGSVSHTRIRTVVSLYALLRAILPILVFFVAHERSSLVEDLPLAFSDFPVTLVLVALSLGVWRRWKGALYYSRWILALAALQGYATLELHRALTAGSVPIPIAEFTATVVLLLMDVSMIVYLSILKRRTTLE